MAESLLTPEELEALAESVDSGDLEQIPEVQYAGSSCQA